MLQTFISIITFIRQLDPCSGKCQCVFLEMANHHWILDALCYPLACCLTCEEAARAAKEAATDAFDGSFRWDSQGHQACPFPCLCLKQISIMLDKAR